MNLYQRFARHLARGLMVAGCALSAFAATANVTVGPAGTTTFVDATSGTSTTTIHVGDTVQWTWGYSYYGVPHSTTSGTCSATCTPDNTWDSGQHAYPYSYSRVFNTVGTFHYFCSVHTVSMQGTIIVLPPSPQHPQTGPVRLRIFPPDHVLANGGTQQYRAFRGFFRGMAQPGGEKEITPIAGWQSSNQSIATISIAGLATAANSGTGSTTISIALGPDRLNAPLTVSSATLSSVMITPANPTVPLGLGLQLNATGVYSDATTHDLTLESTWSSSAPGTATVNNLGQVKSVTQGPATISAAVNLVSGSTIVTVGPPVPESIFVKAQSNFIAQGFNEQFTATEYFSDGSSQDITNTATWTSSDPTLATVNASGLVAAISPGTVKITAAQNGINGSYSLTILSPAPVGRYRVTNAGLYTQMERRGWPSEYWSGQLIQTLNNFDSVVNSTVAQEASLQLDKMRAMGVNTITFELRSADPPNVTPQCPVSPVLGMQWPQPTTSELANLPLFFDLAQSKGMKVWLRLVNTHQEEQPPTNSQTWLGSILSVIKNKPALDLVLFEGDVNVEIGGSCGGQAEPALWMGPTSPQGQYVQWAISYALSQGIPARRLSAEAIVGDYFTMSQPGNQYATDGHLWNPIITEKVIFDNLNLPASQRTYALSFYEHNKCATAGGLPCADLNPDDWAEQTIQNVFSVVGSGNGARIVAPEMGNSVPVSAAWPTNHALESLVRIMEKYNVDGGTFWRWTSFQGSEDTDPTLAQAVKLRGVSFTYTIVQPEVVDMGGFHLPAIPNGSFEADTYQNNFPDFWTLNGNGTGSHYLLTQEAGQPEVPSRGIYALRLATGSGLSDSVTATSSFLAASPNTSYTATANLRFNWIGDPNPSGSPATRPHVFVTLLYFRPDGLPSKFNAQDTFRFFQENSTTGFGTFPVQYTTPIDTTSVQIVFGAARNNLPTAIVFDVDNVR